MAIEERIGPNAGHGVGQADIGQPCAFNKDLIAHVRDGIRNGDGGERLAAIEGAVLDADHRVGYGDLAERLAAPEIQS